MEDSAIDFEGDACINQQPDSKWRGFLRVRVSVDALNPLTTGCPRLDEERVWAELKHEKLWDSCFGCEKFGHLTSSCEDVKMASSDSKVFKVSAGWRRDRWQCQVYNGVEATLNGDYVINKWNGRPYSQRYYTIFENRKTLPVWQQKLEFLQALKSNQTLILVDELVLVKPLRVVSGEQKFTLFFLL
ncbi:hypothetical protein QQP08_002834 [Theobroma cacao]|nr:hypothetical protein QQP08_002834 [Theobroma cacao]